MTALETDDLAETLAAVARLRVRIVTRPEDVRLQRILNTESYRFPDIGDLAYERDNLPVVRFITELLAKHAITGDIDAHDPGTLGNGFMILAVGGPANAALRGTEMSPTNDEWVDIAVRLFLDGVRPR